MKIKISVNGVAPLIMHRFSGGDDMDEKGSKKTSRGKKVYDPKEESEKAAYRNKEGKLYLPAEYFKAAMIKAATEFQVKGHKTYKDFIKSGIIMQEQEIILPQQEYEIDARPMVVQRSRIMRWRPIFKEWNCTFTIEIIDEQWLNEKVVKEILESAGKYKGVGDSRPEYGRFEITEFKKI